MALLYSLLNAEPAPLPQRLKINGVTRTDSSSFTAEELNQAGYTGPFQKPSCDPATQDCCLARHWLCSARSC